METPREGGAGGGGSKSFKEKYDAKLEFLEGGEGDQKPSMVGYGGIFSHIF